jgi:hypothetical protein
VDEARSTAQSKAGEAAILRQKAEKAAKDYEKKVATLRLLHAEEYAKQKAELERVKSEREKLTTDNRFLEHDLALEAGKARQIQRTQRPGIAERSRSGNRISPAVTPKKKVLPYRDGFDDSDLVMLSPSKLRDRSKPSTPKAGAKRKRTGNDSQSPIAPSQLLLDEPRPAVMPPQARVDAKIATELLQRLAKEQNKVRFMQKLVQYHVTEESEDNIFEALTRFAFPSNPDRKMSTILYEQLSLQPLAGSEDGSKNVPEAFCGIVLSLWEQSLAEAYYPPILPLIATMQRIFKSERFSFARQYIARVAPLAIATSDLVAIPLARASLNKNQSPRIHASRAATTKNTAVSSGEVTEPNGKQSKEKEVEIEVANCIDVVACLELLQTLADAASPNPEAITTFWEHMKFDFVLLVLMKAQPMRQIGVMLDLLRTSALQGSFGAIVDGGQRERQDQRENDTLDRLTLLLNEKFGKDADVTCVFELREKVVNVLHVLVFTEHGALLLSTHRHAIGRLFAFLHASITALYLYMHPSDHAPITRSINTVMTILYLLCSSTGSAQVKVNVDIRQKLSVVPGGMHIHLLALTRLAFAERIWYERGIGDGTVEKAHEMLDEWLSPEEGEGLMMMFPASEGSGVETQ